MRARVIKRQNSSYIELPPEMSANEEVELFPLKPGYYLLSIPLGMNAPQGAPAKQGALSSAERAVLMKLLSIRFDQRLPAYVSKALDDDERVVLLELERKGFVNVFKGAKYKDGVYNIPDSIYPLLSQKSSSSAVPASSPSLPQTGQNDLLVILKRQGFIVMNDRNQARELSESLSQEMKNGAVAGVKGFDGKFYVVTKAFLMSAQALISPVLKEDMDAQSVATATKLDPEGCMAVLRIMSEAGEIIEKKRGVFAPV